MKIKEYIKVIDEGENIRIKGQYVLKLKKIDWRNKLFKTKIVVKGIALENYKAGDIAMVAM